MGSGFASVCLSHLWQAGVPYVAQVSPWIRGLWSLGVSQSVKKQGQHLC